MARYIDIEGYRKIFDEEYKKTRQLISEGETHLDNLAEGFSEAGRVIDKMPTADVAPKSEVERLTVELYAMRGAANTYKMHYENAMKEIERLKDYNTGVAFKHYFDSRKGVAREIFEEIGKILYKYAKIAERDKSEYGELIVGDIASAIAEFKKNYPISTEIVRDLAEYAVDQDIQNYKENK